MIFIITTVKFDVANDNVLYSASDDALCKVWDLRMNNGSNNNDDDNNRNESSPAGVIRGHSGGITHVESKGNNEMAIVTMIMTITIIIMKMT